MSHQYVFTQSDRLAVTAWSSLASVTLSVQGTYINDAGEHLPFSFALAPTSDRAATVGSHLLGAGVLQNVVVYASAGSPVRGQVYVRVTKRYGSQSTGLDTAVIVQGYVADGEYLYAPGKVSEGSTIGPGVIRSITGTDPDAGAEISETVPTGALWRLLAFWAALVTDATVSNRQPELSFTDGTTEFFRKPSRDTQAASLTYNYSFVVLGIDHPIEILTQIAAIPHTMLLPAGYTIDTITTNLQAGDNWGAPQLLVEEWLQP